MCSSQIFLKTEDSSSSSDEEVEESRANSPPPLPPKEAPPLPPPLPPQPDQVVIRKDYNPKGKITKIKKGEGHFFIYLFIYFSLEKRKKK